MCEERYLVSKKKIAEKSLLKKEFNNLRTDDYKHIYDILMRNK